jgi:hypothetical protein
LCRHRKHTRTLARHPTKIFSVDTKEIFFSYTAGGGEDDDDDDSEADDSGKDGDDDDDDDDAEDDDDVDDGGRGDDGIGRGIARAHSGMSKCGR